MKHLLYLVVMVTCIRDVTSATAADVEKLFKDKLDHSNPKIRPVWNQSEPVNIEFTAFFVALTDLNEVQQKVEATIWLQVRWKNELLTWNTTDYGGLTKVYPKPETMWRPDIALSNGYDELNPLGLDFVLMTLEHNGRTIWMPGQKVEFLCKVDVTKFPFDTQRCHMSFFNWGGTKEETTLCYKLPLGIEDQVEAIHPNSEWSIIEKTYKEYTESGHAKVQVTLTLKRKSMSLVLTILVPVFLLSFLNVFVFLLPTESGEKLSFAVTVLLSQAVFLSFISGMMPQTSDSISGLSIYISCQLALSTLYVLFTCAIVRTYYRNTSKRPLPELFLKFICMSNKNSVHAFPTSEDEDGTPKKVAFDDCAASGIDVSKRLDRGCFWFFFIVVIFMTTFYVSDGLSN